MITNENLNANSVEMIAGMWIDGDIRMNSKNLVGVVDYGFHIGQDLKDV